MGKREIIKTNIWHIRKWLSAVKKNQDKGIAGKMDGSEVGLIENVVFEQRGKGSEEVNHEVTWRKNILSREQLK